MPHASVARFVDQLRDSEVLDQKQARLLDAQLRHQFADFRGLAADLMQRGWLTPYQVNQIAQGRGRELVLGPYVLLERLGQGGMGQVFKARHQLMNREVALKIIHPERVASADLVARFRREVQAVARLSHPHVIIAHDAAYADGTHFLVMEYVPGCTLAELIKTVGPLPISQACSYIHQAALGMQHAHEQRLVHRDIKPHNLLVTADGKSVKILDLGLARLHVDGSDTNDALTNTEDIMGTPDYIAPEQTRDFHAADIRADIYSLGCTLYCLLAGKPPFPGGTAVDKFIKHREIEPVPVESLRPDVPRPLRDILKKTMAKRPEDRFQTPAELAAALKPWCAPAAADAWQLPLCHQIAQAGKALDGTSNLGETEATCRNAAPGQGPGPTPAELPLTVSTTRPSYHLRKFILPGAAMLAALVLVAAAWGLASFLSARGGDNHGGNENLGGSPGIPAKPVREFAYESEFQNSGKPPEPSKECRCGVVNGYMTFELVPKRTYPGFLMGFGPSLSDFAAEGRFYYEQGNVFISFRRLECAEEVTHLKLVLKSDGAWLLERVTDLPGKKDAVRQSKAWANHVNVPLFSAKKWNTFELEVYRERIAFRVNDNDLFHYDDHFKPKPGAQLSEKEGMLLVGIDAPVAQSALLKVDYLRVWRLVSAN